MQSDQERTEDPTSKRKQDAKNKGQVPRSKELSSFMSIFSMLLGFAIFAPSLNDALLFMLVNLFSINKEIAFDLFALKVKILTALYQLIIPLFSILLFSYVCNFISTIALGGLQVKENIIAIKFEKLSPLKGLKRMFGSNAFVELFKSVLKVLVIGVIVFLLLQNHFDKFFALNFISPLAFYSDTFKLLFFLCIAVTLSLLLIVVVDIIWQKHSHNKNLKMTKQEVKDENKDTDGNPEVKNKIKQLQVQMVKQRMMQEIPNADVIITNPTHFSVALKYDLQKSKAPIVIAKGADLIAFKIREIAKQNNVTILEAKELTRAIYHTTEINQEIPEDLFMAVAKVLAYVFALNEYKKGQGKKPQKPTSIAVPKNMKY